MTRGFSRHLHWRTALMVREAIEEASAAIYEHTRGPIFICSRCTLTWDEKDYPSVTELHRAIVAHEEERLHNVHFKGPGSFTTPDYRLIPGTQIIATSDEIPEHYFAGRPVELVLLGAALCILSLLSVLWIVAQL